MRLLAVGLPLSFCFSIRDASRGVRVKLRKMEAIVTDTMVKPRALKALPIIPDVVAMGMKTARLVSVDASTAIKISFVPSSAALRMFFPSLR